MANIWADTFIDTVSIISRINRDINTLEKRPHQIDIIHAAFGHNAGGSDLGTVYALAATTDGAGLDTYNIYSLDPITGYSNTENPLVSLATTVSAIPIGGSALDPYENWFFPGKLAADTSGNFYLYSSQVTVGGNSTKVVKFNSVGTVLGTYFNVPDDVGHNMFAWHDDHLWFNDDRLLLRIPDTLPPAAPEGVHLSQDSGINSPGLHGKLAFGGTNKDKIWGYTKGNGFDPPINPANFGLDTLLYVESLGELVDTDIREFGFMAYDKIGPVPYLFQGDTPFNKFENVPFRGAWLYDPFGTFISDVIEEPFNATVPPSTANRRITNITAIETTNAGEFMTMGKFTDLFALETPSGGEVNVTTSLQRFNRTNGVFIDYFPTIDDLTEWFGTQADGTRVSIGTRPNLNALAVAASVTDRQILLDWRTAVDALAGRFRNAATDNAFVVDAISPDNLYNVAMGDRSAYGVSPGIQYYTYRQSSAQLANAQIYDIEIGEIYEQILVLKNSNNLSGF